MRFLLRAFLALALALLGPAPYFLAPASAAPAGVSYKFAYTWRGTWVNTTRYSKDDLVKYQGTVYKALVANTGQTPAEGAYWTVFVSKGDQGQGGLTLYADTNALAAVTGQVDGQTAFVKDLGAFRFDSASSTAANGTHVVAPGVGAGRWLALASGKTNLPFFNVKDYGARGDGTTDDYAAIKAAAAAFQAAGKGTLFFPPGTYLINQHRITSGAGANGVTDIEFTGLNGALVSGYGAKIEVKGAFNRAWVSGTTSNVTQLSPFKFITCRNLTVEGFEIDGNVDQMTRDAMVTITGSWAAGNTVTVTVDGTAVVTTLDAGTAATTSTVATAVAAAINANGTVSAKVTAVAQANVVVITPDNATANYAVSSADTGAGAATTTNVTETKLGLVWVVGCTDVTLQDIYLHHCQSDGLNIAASGLVASKRVTARRVRCIANARQGATIGELNQGLFENCDFSYTGNTNAAGTALGAYGYHSPGDGVDVEPNANPTDDGTDAICGELTFLRCNMVGSAGQFSSALGPTFVSSITLDACYIEGETQYPLIMSCGNGQIINCTIDTGPWSLYPIWGGRSNTFTRLAGCTIYSTAEGLRAVDGSGDIGQRVVVENCRFIGQHTATYASNFPTISCRGAVFRNNYVFVPKEAHDGNTVKSISQVVGAYEASGNTWDTDLVDPALWFATSYSSSVNVFNEKQLNAAGYDRRAAWASGQTYAVDTYRTHLSNAYRLVAGWSAAAAWSGVDYTTASFVQNAGIVYRCTTDPGAGTSANAPVHTAGAVTGADGYGWTVMCSAAAPTGTTSVAPTHTTGVSVGADGYAWAYVTGGTKWGINTLSPAAFGNNNWDAETPYSRGPIAGAKVTVANPNISEGSHVDLVIANAAAPTTGRHNVGEVVLNYGQTAGGVTAYYCTTGGTATATTWAITTAYTVGQLVANGTNVYRCVVAGTSAGAGGPSGTTNGQVDNTVTWNYESALAVFQAGPRLPLDGSAAWDPPNLAAGAAQTTTVTVTGAALGDFVQTAFSLSTGGTVLNAAVTAANTITVTQFNPTGAGVDLGNGTIRARVEKQ